MVDTHSSEFRAALEQASSELGLPEYYSGCVRPLFSMPVSQWPMCCGGGCDPCAQTLISVADRVCILLGINAQALTRSP
jgi:hypothetical protein